VKKRKSSYNGLQKKIRGLKLPKIDVWENRYQDKSYAVSLETDEFTCICPKTGLPDFAKIRLSYQPEKYCVELKSFKLYLHAFRNVGIFHEHVTNRILDDLVSACNPRSAKITAEFKLRGGIRTTVERDYARH
jgi:7-cyano-7-deazaguanine reductase